MIYQLQQTRSAALAPLSPTQRQKLAAMARFAYEEVGPDQAFDDWRHEEVRKCVGKGGLTECTNGDYNPLKAHFLAISGNVVGSMKATIRGETEPRRNAFWHLMKACTEAKDVMPEAMKYARGFILNKRNVSLEDADEKTIWHAVYVVRRKAQAERKKKARAATGGSSAADVLSDILGLPAKKCEAKTGVKRASSPRRKYTEGPF